MYQLPGRHQQVIHLPCCALSFASVLVHTRACAAAAAVAQQAIPANNNSTQHTFYPNSAGGATSKEFCKSEPCPIGYICTGNGPKELCPGNRTTSSSGGSCQYWFLCTCPSTLDSVPIEQSALFLNPPHRPFSPAGTELQGTQCVLCKEGSVSRGGGGVCVACAATATCPAGGQEEVPLALLQLGNDKLAQPAELVEAAADSSSAAGVATQAWAITVLILILIAGVVSVAFAGRLPEWYVDKVNLFSFAHKISTGAAVTKHPTRAGSALSLPTAALCVLAAVILALANAPIQTTGAMHTYAACAHAHPF